MRYGDDRTRTRRRAEHRNGKGARRAPSASPTAVVIIVQCALCLLLLAAVYTLRFVRAETFETLGGYYKAVMNEQEGEAVFVGAFGEPVTFEDVYGFLSESRWSATVADSGGVGGAATEPWRAYTGAVAFTARAAAPVEGWVTSGFGMREDPFSGGNSFHTGLDIAAPQGADIYAVLPGTVTECGWDDDYGNYIKLTHADGFETWYCHCSGLLAGEGASVRAGERIALVGTTGSSTGSHLHLTLYIGGMYADPMELFPR